jgi:transcriptional regulator with PAS, ATPase and Fis domain
MMRRLGFVPFLDEIGDLSNVSQVILLRFLQEGDHYPLGIDQSKRLRARIVAPHTRIWKNGRFRG